MMLIAGEMVKMVGSLMVERVRPLVGFKGWDYCVVWKLTEDQRFLDWMDCCCAGGGQNGGEDQLHFHVPSCVLPCRDAMVQHARTKSCDLLAQLPSSISLGSGIHGQTLILNQPRWLNYCNSSDSSILEETVGTGLLIPVLGGLIELFVTKQVAEDQHVIDFVTTQWHMITSMEEMMNSSNMDSIFSGNVDESNVYEDQNDQFQAPISSLTAAENSKDLPSDRSAKRIRLCGSPLNFLEHDYVFLEGSHNSIQDGGHMNSIINKPTVDSVSECSEQIDDRDEEEEEELKYQRKTGKGAQSKNIDAERRRRKKLNDRLYTLRSLVPKISKLDRASILGDAIEFVKELQKQAKDLQDELEENSEEEDEESGKIINPGIISCSNTHDLHYEILNDKNGGPVVNIGPQTENEEAQTPSNGVFAATAAGVCRPPSVKQKEETDKIADEKAQQMEPQVEVALIEGNEFYVKVFCEHRAGGFVRLMEALSFLGLEVSNANVTLCKGLVSNAFKVEQKRDCEMVQAHHVRDSLLQLTKNDPSGKWPDRMPYSSENGDGGGSGGSNFNDPHHHIHSHLFSSHHLHHLHFIHM